jgi:hypothetical protein
MMRSTSSFRFVCAVILASVAAGCGRETYEHRLDESRRYFTYLDKLNQNLAAPWAGRGVELRVPKQFQEIAVPKPKAKKAPAKKGAGAKDAPDPPADDKDPRQPNYADLIFPGLVGAFSTQLSVAGKGREPGYLYVLSNGELLGRKGSDEKAAQFNKIVLHTIAQAVGQPDPAPEKMATDSVPKGDPKDAWVPNRTFKVVRPGFAASIDGKDYRIEIFNTKQDKNEVSLVYVLPESVSPTEKLATNIDLSLETLKVTHASSGGGGGGGKTAATRGL